MPSEKYALEVGGPPRLEISRKPLQKKVTIRLDGKVVGTFTDEELEEGKAFPLDDGSAITVQSVRTPSGPKIEASRFGQPLLDSASEPSNRFGAAYGTVFFAGGLSLVLGLWAEISRDEFLLHRLGIDWIAIGFGLTLLGLGFWVKRKSNTALALAITVFIASSVWALFVVLQHPVITRAFRFTPQGAQEFLQETSGVMQQAFLFSLVVRGFLLAAMIRGFGAISSLKLMESLEKE